MVPRLLALALGAAILSPAVARAQKEPQSNAAPPEVQIKQRQDKAGMWDMKVFMNGPAAGAEAAKPDNGAASPAAPGKPPQGPPDLVFTFKDAKEGTVAGKAAIEFKGMKRQNPAKIGEASLAKMVAFIGARETDLSKYSEAEKTAAKGLYSVLAGVAGSRCAQKTAAPEEAKALRGAEAFLLKQLPSAVSACNAAAAAKIDCAAQPPECNR